MSVLQRSRENDAIAAIYGEYLSFRELSAIKMGERLELLCGDGLNYVVEVKDFNRRKGIIHLHFYKWSAKYDFLGPVDKIYLAPMNSYTQGISSNNNYPECNFDITAPENRDKKRRLKTIESSLKNQGKVQSNSQSEETKTRYPDDYLSKPRLSLRRRRDETPLPHSSPLASTSILNCDPSSSSALFSSLPTASSLNLSDTAERSQQESLKRKLLNKDSNVTEIKPINRKLEEEEDQSEEEDEEQGKDSEEDGASDEWEYKSSNLAVNREARKKAALSGAIKETPYFKLEHQGALAVTFSASATTAAQSSSAMPPPPSVPSLSDGPQLWRPPNYVEKPPPDPFITFSSTLQISDLIRRVANARDIIQMTPPQTFTSRGLDPRAIEKLLTVLKEVAEVTKTEITPQPPPALPPPPTSVEAALNPIVSEDTKPIPIPLETATIMET